MANDPVFSAQVEKDVYHEILARGGSDRMWVTEFEANAAYVGKNLEELATLRQESLFEAGKYLQLENAAKILSYTMIEDDLEHYLTRDYIAQLQTVVSVPKPTPAPLERSHVSCDVMYSTSRSSHFHSSSVK